METTKRLRELLSERHLSLFQLSRISGIPYETLRSTDRRGGQLSVDTIERVCLALEIPMSEFFR